MSPNKLFVFPLWGINWDGLREALPKICSPNHLRPFQMNIMFHFFHFATSCNSWTECGRAETNIIITLPPPQALAFVTMVTNWIIRMMSVLVMKCHVSFPMDDDDDDTPTQPTALANKEKANNQHPSWWASWINSFCLIKAQPTNQRVLPTHVDWVKPRWINALSLHYPSHGREKFFSARSVVSQCVRLEDVRHGLRQLS